MKVKIGANAELRKIIAAVARERGGDIVDLPQIESDVRMAIIQQTTEAVWECFGADVISAELAEKTLQALERTRDKEIIRRLLRPLSAAEQYAQRAAHRAARGVKKVRGAK